MDLILLSHQTPATTRLSPVEADKIDRLVCYVARSLANAYVFHDAYMKILNVARLWQSMMNNICSTFHAKHGLGSHV
jgi:hypothetical protein